MVRWQCSLRPSRLARRLTLLLHGTLILVLLLVPWPGSASLPRMALLLLVLIECHRSLQRIQRCRGEIALRQGGVLGWQQREWRIASRPWLTRQAILLSLRETTGRRQRLWLFADSMENSEWRLLRQQLLNEKGMGDKQPPER